MIVLIPIDENGEDRAPIQFDQPHVRVGRGPHNELILDDEDRAASYEHAMIAILGSRAVVVCEVTANPTYIDGADVSATPEDERLLRPGDIVSFGKGKSIFRVHRVGEAAEAPRPMRRQVQSSPPPPPVLRNESFDRSVYPVRFQVFRHDEVVREEVFHQPLIRIGRMRSSHLLLDDKSVSRTHAAIEVTAEDEVLLIDLDSGSGTSVNGKRVKKALLASGDLINFGDARVCVRYGEAAARVAPRAPAPALPEGRNQPPTPSNPPLAGDDLDAPNHTQVLSRDELEPYDGPRLVLQHGGVEQKEFFLTKTQTTIGRLRQNDIQLDDRAVSGKHALLVAEAGVFLIVDQNSSNGTYLNGAKCAGEKLQDGDIIQIGRYELVFRAPRPVVAMKPPGTEILDPEAARAMFAKIGGRRGEST